MNKRGTDRVISVYWFAILFIVAGGIVYMALVFYGSPYDVREVEADFLINKVADCIASGGKLNENWNGLSNENFLQTCKLTFEVEDEFGWNNNQHFVEIKEADFESGSEAVKLSSENSYLRENCEETTGTGFAFCKERSFYVLDGNVQKVIKIFAAIGKTNKNAK